MTETFRAVTGHYHHAFKIHRHFIKPENLTSQGHQMQASQRQLVQKESFFNMACLHLRVPGGVQHGVWTRLNSFLIIRESIDITMLMVQQK